MGLALTIASTATTVLGAGISAISSIQSANLAEAQAKYDAKVARNNAILARREAEDARKRGEIEEAETRKLGKLELGEARARAAARGVVVDDGSAALITEDIATQTELDALTVRANAQREALAFEQDALNFESEAGLLDETAEAEGDAGVFTATGTLLSAGGKVADRWYTYLN